MKNSIFKFNNILLIVFVFIYTYLFVFIIDWESIKGQDFKDITNYLYKVIYFKNNSINETIEGIKFLFSEALWKYILLYISHFTNDYRYGLYLVSYTALAIYSLFTFKRVPIVLASILLFNPMFIDLIMGQIRMALAFSLLLIAYTFQKSKYSIIIVFVSILIHTSILLIMVIYFILQYLAKNVHGKIYYLYVILIALGLALFLKYGVSSILIEMNDRRVHYAEMAHGSSLSYSLFWFLLTLILFFKIDFNEKNEKIIIGFSMLMMSLFFFSSLIGAYGQRYVAISIPLIIISIYNLKGRCRQIVFILFILYTILQWFYWAKLFIV